jgi:RNA polymerase sigma-70 factor (ECF subfamily)
MSVGSLHQLPAREPAAAPGPPADTGEAALVTRARGGDIEAWSRLYQEHFDRVFRHIAYLTGDTQAAEDLVQETFARAFVGLSGFTGEGNFIGWLRGIAVNVVRKHWRSHYRGTRAMDRLEQMAAGTTAGPDADPEGSHLRQRRAEVLLAILDTLPAPLREAFVACDLQEQPVQQAAAELGVSPGNLRVRATRARARIRSELVRLGWLSEAGDKKEVDHVDP